MDGDIGKDLFSVDFVARVLDLAPSTVRLYLRTRGLGRRVGQIWVIPREDARALDERNVKPGPARARPNE
jgi:hypothetical protein